MSRAEHRARLAEAEAIAAEVADMLVDEGVGDVKCTGSTNWEDRIVVKIATVRPGLVELLKSYDFSRVEDRGVCTIAWV